MGDGSEIRVRVGGRVKATVRVSERVSVRVTKIPLAHELNIKLGTTTVDECLASNIIIARMYIIMR